jgi:hypothetical protein
MARATIMVKNKHKDPVSEEIKKKLISTGNYTEKQIKYAMSHCPDTLIDAIDLIKAYDNNSIQGDIMIGIEDDGSLLLGEMKGK